MTLSVADSARWCQLADALDSYVREVRRAGGDVNHRPYWYREEWRTGEELRSLRRGYDWWTLSPEELLRGLKG